MTEWQSIESAPKDVEILIGKFRGDDFDFHRSTMFYLQSNEMEGEYFEGWVWSEDYGGMEDPTHWMPLPEPPTKEDQ